jgi:hypothetical protein
MDSSDSAKTIQFQDVSSKLLYSLKNLIKKGKVYKIKFGSRAFAGDEMGGEFCDIKENPEDFGADIIIWMSVLRLLVWNLTLNTKRISVILKL